MKPWRRSCRFYRSKGPGVWNIRFGAEFTLAIYCSREIIGRMWAWLIGSIILGAFGQVFMSVAMKSMGKIPTDGPLMGLAVYYIKAAFTLPMMGAVGCYGLSFLLWLGVLSQKDLSLARPMMSMGYLITLAYGFYAGENVTPGRVLGTVLIIAGLFFIVYSAEQTKIDKNKLPSDPTKESIIKESSK